MKHIGTKELETERLILRKISVNDANEMYNNWASNPNVARYTTWNAHKNIDETTPWTLAKDENEKDRLEAVLYNLLETIRNGAYLIAPFLPETSEKIFEQLNVKSQNDVVDTYNVGKPYPLFERIDKEKKLAEIISR